MVEMPHSVWDAIAEHHLERPEYKRYHAFERMGKCLLGENPAIYPVVCLSPSTIALHLGMFRAAFDSPRVDTENGPVSPGLRRAAALAASRSLRCSYCVAHSACAGDVIRGPIAFQVQRGGQVAPLSLDEDNPELSAAERAVMKYAALAVSRSVLFRRSSCSLSSAGDLVKNEIGEHGLEVIKSVVAMVGFISALTDALGVPTEPKLERFATEHLLSLGCKFDSGFHHYEASEIFDDDAEVTSAPLGKLVGAVTNLMQTGWAVVMTGMLEAEFLRNIPQRISDLDNWVSERLGPASPSFFARIQRPELKRALAFSLRVCLLPEDKGQPGGHERKWSILERSALAYTYGTLTSSTSMLTLGEHVAGVERDVLDAFANGRDSRGTWSEALLDGRRFLVDHVTSEGCAIPPKTIQRIVSSCDAESVVELCGIISWFYMWDRMSIMFGEPG